MPSSSQPFSRILALDSSSREVNDENQKKQSNNKEQSRKRTKLLTTLELAKCIASLSDFDGNSSSELPSSKVEDKHYLNDADDNNDRSKPLKKRLKRDHHVVDHRDETAQKNRSFPVLLRDILDNDTNSSLISWLSHGKGFKIVNREKFIKQFTPDPWKRYSVFTKDLVKWNFIMIERGRDAGSFYNELFQRDQPRLQDQMRCCDSKRVCILAPRIPKETTLRKKSMPLTNEQMMATILRKKRSSLDLAKARLNHSLAYSKNHQLQQQHQHPQQEQQHRSHHQGQINFATMAASSNMSLSELSQPQDKMTQLIVSAAVRALARFEKAAPSSSNNDNGNNSSNGSDTTKINEDRGNVTPSTSNITSSSPQFGPMSCPTSTMNLNANATSHALSTSSTNPIRRIHQHPPFKMPNTNLIGAARKISELSRGFNGGSSGYQVPLGHLLTFHQQKERQASLSLTPAVLAGSGNDTHQGLMEFVRSRDMQHDVL